MMPDNSWKLLWDAFLLFLILLNTLIIPLNLCFDELVNVHEKLFNTIELIMLYLISVDMVLSIFTAYYSKGVVIKKQTLIIQNYFSNGFLWDFLSVLPYFLSSHFQLQVLENCTL